MYEIPRELRAVIDADIPMNSTRRVHHLECSEGKSAALSVRRMPHGFVFHCFRCGDFKGFIGAEKLPADMIVKAIKSLGEPIITEMDDLRLPEDFIEMSEEDKRIPLHAFGWLWESGLTSEMMFQHGICWSDHEQKVIIPIMNNRYSIGTEIIGWLGRTMTKDADTRYIIRKKKYLEERIYFIATDVAAKQGRRVVVVEDPLSAIRVHAATGLETRALLNTSIGADTLHDYKDKHVTLWLDNGQLINMVENVARASVYGIDMDYISTRKDPKAYNDLAIKMKINGEEEHEK
jgi:hypothetical protein